VAAEWRTVDEKQRAVVAKWRAWMKNSARSRQMTPIEETWRVGVPPTDLAGRMEQYVASRFSSGCNRIRPVTPHMDWQRLRDRISSTKDRASVLVVEDDPALREVLRSTLSALGYDVTAAEDALRALPVLARHPDVALCDVHLPGASGLWLADEIRSTSPFTAIVLATADDAIRPFESLRPGIVAYLVKPFDDDELKAAVEAGVQWSAARRSE
jgi:CheY-like chemotaxis protein